jgi:hypothetical protein
MTYPLATRVRLKETQEEDARAQEAAAQEEFERELLQLRAEVKKLKLEHGLWLFEQKYGDHPSQQLDLKYPGQPRDDHGRFSFGKKPNGVQLAGDITGFIKHGINQAISRGVSPGSLHDAVVNPIQILPQANGTTQYVGGGAVVVLNPLGQVVTTCQNNG